MPGKIGSILLNANLITSEDIEIVLNFQKKNGFLFGESLLHLNICSEEQVNYALINQIELRKKVITRGFHLKELGSLFKWLFKEKVFLFTIFFISLLRAIFSDSIIIPLALGFLIDHIIPSGNAIFLVTGVMITGGAFFLGHLFEFFNNFTVSALVAKVSSKIVNDIFFHINSLSYPFFSKYKKGDLLSRVSENMEEVTKVLHLILTSLFINSFIFIFLLLLLLNFNIMLTLISALIIIITLIAPGKMSDTSNRYIGLTPGIIGKISLFLKEFFQSAKYIKSNNKEKNFYNRFKLLIREFYRNDSNKWVIWNLSFNLKIALNILMSTIIIFYGGHLVIDDKLSIGSFLAYYLLITEFIPKMDFFYHVYINIQVLKSSWRRIKEVLDFPQAYPVKSDNSREIIKIKDSITIESLSFKHSLSSDMVMENISMKMKFGEVYPIIGKSGTGKSTFLKILLGLYNATHGSVLFDQNDSNDMDLYDLWGNIAYMEQDSFLFEDRSFMDNIMAGSISYKKDISPEEVYEAAKKAQIYEYITSLPDGFDTLVGDKNVLLSGGEKQRIALARIFLKNPFVIILDEPTSALDAENSSLILNTILKEKKNKIIIISTHKLEYISKFSNLFYFKQGDVEVINNDSKKVKKILKEFKSELDGTNEVV